MSRLLLLACALSSLTACEVPHAWTESDLRDIAREEAQNYEVVGAADAGAVDENFEHVRQENENLRAIVDIQGQQIDALNDSVSNLEQNLSSFIDHHNAEAH